MGLISNVLLLPIAPVRGVRWVAEVVTDEAERQMAESASPARRLEELSAAVANGEIGPEDAEQLEGQLIEQMLSAEGS